MAARVLARLRRAARWWWNFAKRRPPHHLSLPGPRGVAPRQSRGRWVHRSPPPRQQSAAARERPARAGALPSKWFTDRVPLPPAERVAVWDQSVGTAGVKCGPPCSKGRNSIHVRLASKESLPRAAARRGRPPWARRACHSARIRWRPKRVGGAQGAAVSGGTFAGGAPIGVAAQPRSVAPMEHWRLVGSPGRPEATAAPPHMRVSPARRRQTLLRVAASR